MLLQKPKNGANVLVIATVTLTWPSSPCLIAHDQILTFVQTYGHFCQKKKLFTFLDNFACVNANCIHLGSGVYFSWNFNIPPSFPLIHLFCTRYKKNSSSQRLLDKIVPIETH